MASAAVTPAAASSSPPLIIGRYAIFDEVARGGMAAVHVGRLSAPGGFTRTVAVKRLHPAFASDPEFVAMFLDEARLAARITHPNVVSTMDVVATKGELFMVMEYIHGESLSNLLRASREKKERVPVEIAVQIVVNVLFGLHAAHEAMSAEGHPLAIVHRDMSPQNVLVGVDGLARVIDFGVAKAAARMRETRDGNVKGKVSYMSPEQLGAKEVDRRTDIWAASVILWEALAGKRLFDYEELGQIVALVLGGQLDPPSVSRGGAGDVSPELDRIVMKGLAVKHEDRWATANEMALALEAAVAPIAQRTVANWVEATADERLRYRADIISRTEHTEIPLPTFGTLPPPAIEAIEKATTTFSGLHPAATTVSAPPASSSAKSLPSPREEPTVAESSGSISDSVRLLAAKTPSRKSMALIVSALLLLGVLGSVMIVKTMMSSRGGRVDPEAAPTASASASAPTAATASEPTTATTTLPPPVTIATTTTAPPTTATTTGRRVTAARATTTPTAVPAPTPSPTPSPSPSPTPSPQPTPTPTAPPVVVVEKPKFVVASARVDVGAPSVVSGTSATNVNRVIAPLGPRMTECYRAALPKMGAPTFEGVGNLHIETDEDGVIVKAIVSGAVTAPAACIAGAVSGKKLPNVDTGRARADVPLTFHAQ